MNPGDSASSTSMSAGWNAPARSSPRQPFGEPAHELVTRNLLEHRTLEHVLGPASRGGADHDARDQAHHDHDQDRDDLPELHGRRNRRGDRRNQREQAGQRLRQQQDGEVNRQYDQQSADERRLGELGQALHVAVLPCERRRAQA